LRQIDAKFTLGMGEHHGQRSEIMPRRLGGIALREQVITPCGDVQSPDVGKKQPPETRPRCLQANRDVVSASLRGQPWTSEIGVDDFAQGCALRLLPKHVKIAALQFALSFAPPGFGIGLEVEGSTD